MTELEGGVERLNDLLIKRALWGIDTGESRELARLGHHFPDVDLESVDATVALLDAIELGPSPPLPPDLRDAIDAAAPKQQAAGYDAATSVRTPVLPWLAAAALAVVAVAGWWRPASAPSETVSPLASMDTAVVAPFGPGADPDGANVSGEVRWQPGAQGGQIVLAGLPVNDTADTQYQLWIHDATRDERFPVFGGVFDVTGTGSVTVSIEPAMPVREVIRFTITLEPRGGAVVSERERIAIASLN